MRRFGMLLAALCVALAPSAAEDAGPVHGLWVWKTASVLTAPRSADRLRDFCRANGIREVYLSFSRDADAARVGDVVAVLHRAAIRVEALLSPRCGRAGQASRQAAG